ncbi:MAG: ROK family protein [Nitrospinaceae bacterium]|nr:ROK family protein [Nitrospinaceae bacterium]MBT3822441.1 ROK family protein [Nitrospinaceae bacterium]MBT4095777.1 ROK family protein [Nitrospinaceae bacterium]MBT4430478.1 ROK family protein [Nitrospinaceae bacterium]MBT5366722.1 ROK family protein [Nitrospinaceae bacterium]
MSGTTANGYYIGLDLGGTQIKGARFSYNGTPEAEFKNPSKADESLDAIIAAVHTTIKNLSRDGELYGLGIGAAGLIDTATGRIITSPNIPILNGIDLKARIKNDLDGVPMHIMNDANAAALGEYFSGAGQHAKSMFLLTLGTGIGGGFIINGQLWEGAAGIGAEVGHICVQADGPLCHCGARGCLEAFISAWALSRDAEQLARSAPDSPIAALCDFAPHSLAKLAIEGDAQARALWENAATFLGIGIANLMNLLNPEIIVLAGGLCGAGDLLYEPARRAWEKQAYDAAHTSTSVEFGDLGEWAGARGAVQVYLQK